MKHKPRSLEFCQKRFLSHVTKAGFDECWIWNGARSGTGAHYGQAGYQGKRYTAHRLAFILFVGPVPDDLEVCHHCDNPLCVNPRHLWVGSHQENMQDRENKFRRPRDRGEANVRAKLTWDDVTLIREQLSVGIPRRHIADTFHVTKTTIRDIELERKWKEEWRPK